MSWDTPSEEDIPGILIGYMVYYKEISSTSNHWATGRVWNTDGPYPIYTMTSLEAYTAYTVNVSTLSLEGEGKAASINITTEEGGGFQLFLSCLNMRMLFASIARAI